MTGSSANTKDPTTAASSCGALETEDAVSAAARGLPVETVREEDDDYPGVVVVLNDRWRVIEGNCGIQWVLQHRDGQRDGCPIWRGRSYCRTRSGLLIDVRRLCGSVMPTALLCLYALPEWFPEDADG